MFYLGEILLELKITRFGPYFDQLLKYRKKTVPLSVT